MNNRPFRHTSSSVIWMCALIFSGACQDSASVKSTAQPNVVFILADDLGVHDLSVLGSEYYETPHIDQIAREGTIFSQGYATRDRKSTRLNSSHSQISYAVFCLKKKKKNKK